MTQIGQLSHILQKKPFLIKGPVLVFFSIVAFAIVAFEFTIDVTKSHFWYRLVISLDAVLIAAYCIFIIHFVCIYRTIIFNILRQHKADAAYALTIAALLFSPRLAAGLIIVRLLIAIFMLFLETKLGLKLLNTINLRPSQTLALSFMGLIAVGTVLLSFPAATISGNGLALIDALFTMTSASCVTGLSTIDVGTSLTRFGQAVVLVGIQAGGLGIMVLSAAFVVLAGGTIPSRRQVGLREVLDVTTPEGLKSLIRSVTAATVIMEFFGAVMLFILWQDVVPGIADRIWWAIFHAVSAFCNAGFALASNSLIAFVHEPMVSFVFMILITAGGLGFYVISDIWNSEVWEIKRPRAVWNRLEIQTRVVILATVILNASGMLLFLFFEYDGVLRGLSIENKIVASLFQVVSLRTAGFNTVTLADIAGPTIMLCVAFMFIGAAPGSTGGGIKVTTAAISFMTLRAMLRGRQDVELMGRRVAPTTVSRALAIVLIACVVVTVFLGLLLATQKAPFERLLFEVVSAFATVGFTLDVTPGLNKLGKLIIIFVMFIGRIGPLTLALAIGEKKIAQGYQLPKGRIAVG